MLPLRDSPDDVVADNAVIARDVCKNYGPHVALDSLNATVPRGGIYGLLGPSGCGKTTFLRCLVSRLKPDSGDLIVLGNVPGARHHGIPGSLVGFMPQELALYEKMTVTETLNYFGRLHGMTMSAVRERTSFLITFLKLPEPSRVIENLSGGQKRRVSFAIALLQEPYLLILDEPTVGVDPILRQRIWDHLVEISRNSRCTIIITTHYIEEARQAGRVGLMRRGRLLAEASPIDLMERCNQESLEDVFLHLCQYDQANDDDEEEDNGSIEKVKEIIRGYGGEEGGINEREPLMDVVNNASNPPLYILPLSADTFSDKAVKFFSPPKPRNILALVIKSLINMRRNIGFLLFQFMLPAMQIVIFCLSIGRDPTDLHMAVVNNESTPLYGAQFLTYIDQHYLPLTYYNESFEEAYKSVKQGDNWGIINIGANFSQDLLLRFVSKHIDDKTLSGGSIHLDLDMTNMLIAATIQQQVISAFEEFAQNVMNKSGINPAVVSLPIIVENPIYGDLHPTFTNFMAPGIILSITYFLATGLTALSFVLEKKEGLLDRSLIAAVSAFEVMSAHIIAQTVVLVVQIALLLVFVHLVFLVPVKGSIFLEILITLFTGLGGMALGLLISALSSNEIAAIQLSLGSVYPSLLLSGIIWPVEAIPQWLRYISFVLPMTYPAEAMRSIISRGWDMTYLAVWRGFLVSVGWGWGLMALSVLIIKWKII